MSRDEEIKHWQDTLISNFSYNGIVGGTMLPNTKNLERVSGDLYTKSFYGHRLIYDAFQDLLISTLLLALGTKDRKTKEDYFYYNYFLQEINIQCLSFRACEVLAQSGYPSFSVSLQRTMLERCIAWSGCFAGFTNVKSLSGFTGEESLPPTEEQLEKAKNRRKKEEIKIRNIVLFDSKDKNNGNESLKILVNMFDSQIHRSLLTAIGESKQGIGAPAFNETSYSMYMNRFIEIAWMTLRLLPFLQKEKAIFGKTWQEKWLIMDQSMEFSVNSLLLDGKEIASEFKNIIMSKFNFSPDNSFLDT